MLVRSPRRAARVAIFAPDDTLFLFRYDNEEVGVHWAMPGGGLDAGESLHEGVQREVREETGWTDIEPGPLLCTWEHDYTRSGLPVRQHEHIFVGHGPRRDPLGDLAAAHAEDGILRWHWFTSAELADTREALWPPQLPDLVAAFLRDVPRDPTPAHLGYVPNEL
jgi:ADP-ribose pyrophosphatase YjhB (NUDIX family)